jgi:hypothetical protein
MNKYLKNAYQRKTQRAFAHQKLNSAEYSIMMRDYSAARKAIQIAREVRLNDYKYNIIP